MGHKKRNAATRSKTLPEAAEDADVFVNGEISNDQKSTEKAPEESEPADFEEVSTSNESNPSSSSYASIKLDCERALLALRRGSYSKALKLMKDLCSKHKNSLDLALIHRVQGTIFLKVASIMDDANAKQRHVKNAIDSARKAVDLSPNSIEFSHFYANLLYESANDSKEYEEVARVCQRGLAIKNPVDPAKESLQDENQQKISGAETRITNLQTELQSLIQKSNFASISTWVKNLGNGDEKFRFIPIRRVLEDPMELKSGQVRRPNEIKKVAKTLEERRKEIEVRVAAARLLQQKSESPHLTSDGDNANRNSKKPDSSSGLGQRTGERRKSGNARKSGSSDERRDLVRSYWNSMSLYEKEDLLRIRVSDLRALFGLPKDRPLSEVLDEALSFGEAHKLWRFWVCCRCHEKYADASSFMQHVVQEHMGSLLPKMQAILPQNVGNEWTDMLLNCSWKPLDLNAAIKMLEEHPKSSTPCESSDGSSECIIDTKYRENELDSFFGKRKSDVNCNGSMMESREVEHIEWMECDEDHCSKGTSLDENWPVSDDPARAKLLEGIHSIFEALVKHKYLAASHLSKVMNFAVEELMATVCGSQYISNIDQTPLCICLLGTRELKKILTFLQEISESCGLNRLSDKSNVGTDSNISMQGADAVENIVFTEDASFLVFDEHFLPCKVPAVNAISSPPTLFNDNGVLLDSDALLSWIFRGASSGEQLASWKRIEEEKTQRGLEILQLLEKESNHMQSLCERKSEHLSYEEALQTLKDICIDECKEREHAVDFTSQSYESLLKRRREELIENDKTTIGNNIELDAITNVLKDAESFNVKQYGFKETYNGGISHLRDLESGDDDGWRTKDYLHQVDSCIEAAIQRQKEQVSIEISKMDARIMRVIAEMQQLEVQLDPASSSDFRLILVPLMKSYIRARLEDLAEKDATEKSDAAREAFLAELAQDSKKGIGAAFDSSKHAHEKTKNRRKNKDNAKSKNLKATYSDEFQDKTAEEIFLASACDEDDHDSRIAVPGPDDVLRLQEEYKRRIELEAEERKLEDTLEYQRRIENEAKQKHLAELRIKYSKTNIEKAETNVLADEDLSHCNDEEHANEQLTTTKDPLVLENGFHNILDGAPKTNSNGDILRRGRRVRRQKRPAVLSGGRSLPVSPEKEDIDLGQPRFVQNSHDKDNGEQTFGLLQDGDDEERFQADLKKAVCQSLDDDNRMDTYGMGLKNEIGEYNCFLNVIIQSLWHLKRFRDELLWKSASGHVHVGDPCVICALCDIFTALSVSCKDNKREAIAPTSLRVALSNLYPDSNFFQEGQMNDASEVLGVIFDCLHKSFTVAPTVSDMKSVDGSCMGSWDCNNVSCIAHSIFGMDIFERMNCYNCGLESRHLKYTSFFHNINASALRTMKVTYPENSFDELLNLVEMNHLLTCDMEAGGCGKVNYIHHILSAAPHVFTTVLGWQNTRESIENITATLDALSTEIGISSLYRGLDPQSRHCLVSVVCYYGQHYLCFAYSHDHDQWIMYDDKIVKVTGGWNDVLATCKRGCLQPQLLLYEAVN